MTQPPALLASHSLAMAVVYQSCAGVMGVTSTSASLSMRNVYDASIPESNVHGKITYGYEVGASRNVLDTDAMHDATRYDDTR